MCQTISGLPPTASSGLGMRVGERAHALTASGGEDDGNHDKPQWRTPTRPAPRVERDRFQKV